MLNAQTQIYFIIDIEPISSLLEYADSSEHGSSFFYISPDHIQMINVQ